MSSSRLRLLHRCSNSHLPPSPLRNLINRARGVCLAGEEFREIKVLCRIVNRAKASFSSGVPRAPKQKLKFARGTSRGCSLFSAVVTARKRKPRKRREKRTGVTETFTRCIYNRLKSIAVRYREKNDREQQLPANFRMLSIPLFLWLIVLSSPCFFARLVLI